MKIGCVKIEEKNQLVKTGWVEAEEKSAAKNRVGKIGGKNFQQPKTGWVRVGDENH